jgi:hypothetical protein
MTNAKQGPTAVTVRVPFKLARRGGRKVVSAFPGQERFSPKPHVDDALLYAVVRAFYWKRQLDDGVIATVTELAAAEKLNTSFVAHQLRLTLLSPGLVEAILCGRQPQATQLQPLVRNFSENWQAQLDLFWPTALR